MIVRNRTGNKIIESEFSYLELKYLLKTELNHGFKYLRWIVCWDFSKGIKDGSDFEGIEKGDFRVLESGVKDGVTHYFLTSKTSAIRTQVIKLREYLEQKIALKFESPTA